VTRRNPPGDLRPIPGAPAYHATQGGDVWRHDDRPAPWERWVKLRPHPVSGAGLFVNLVIDGRIVTRSTAVLCRAACDADPERWAAAISGTRRPAKPRRTPREAPPRALPDVAPPCPVRAASRPLVTPRPAALCPVRIDPEPLELTELRARGERHGRARLTDDQVVDAKRLRADGWSYVALASRYGVAETTISAAVRSLTWIHLPAD